LLLSSLEEEIYGLAQHNNGMGITGLTDGIDLGLAAVAVVGSTIAAAKAIAGVWLGRQFN